MGGLCTIIRPPLRKAVIGDSVGFDAAVGRNHREHFIIGDDRLALDQAGTRQPLDRLDDSAGVSKDIVSRVSGKIKSDWDAWNARSLTDKPS
jgi:hypothetical protein